MKIIVTGTRQALSLDQGRRVIDTLRTAVAQVRSADIVVVHGHCKTGVDAFVDALCADSGITVERWPAKWGTLGAAAGPIRNGQMVRAGADLCLAFPLATGSRGTQDCINKARLAGIPTTVVEL